MASNHLKARVKRALLMNDGDNCVVALEHIDVNDKVSFEGGTIAALNSVELGHKLAVRPIKKGEKVIKHNASIGSASQDILPGEHIHTHNLKSDYIEGFHYEQE